MGLKVLQISGLNGEIIGDIQEDVQTTVKNPCRVIVQMSQKGPNVMLVPMMMLSDQTSITFDNKSILYSYPPNKELTDNYNQLHSSIIQPEKKSIILG